MEQVLIPARFNGPPTSGNGGYSCGLVARFIDGPARVRLHSPPPLDEPLDLRVLDEGAVELTQGDTLVASGWPATLSLEIPPAPGLEAAQEGRERYLFKDEHNFSTCFVCGTGRAEGDGLELFTGPLGEPSAGPGIVACDWRPAPDLLDDEGCVRSEIVWAALDCPGCFGALGGARTLVLLGELVLEQYAPVPGDEDLVVYAWPEGASGRKFYGGAAIASADGTVLACSYSTWIALRQ